METNPVKGSSPLSLRTALLQRLKKAFAQASLITQKGIKYSGEIHIPLPDKDVFVLGEQTFFIVAHAKRNGISVWATPPLQVYEIVDEFERSQQG